MIEALAAGSRFLATAGAAAILGSTLFRQACLRSDPPSCRAAWRWLFAVALLAVLLGHGGMLLAQLSALRQIDTQSTALLDLVGATHVGRVWAVRAAVVAALAVAIAVTMAARPRPWPTRIAAVLAALYLALGVWGGHAAAAQSPWTVMPANLVHILALAVWIGALPAWLIVVRAFARAGEAALPTTALASALERFSRFAMLLMLGIVLSGYWLADGYVETAGDLFGTRYGALILAKLLLLAAVLLLANRLRTRFLPALRSMQHPPTSLALRHAGLEWLLALAILVCAAWLAQTTPALHEPAPHWWFPFRWSVAATWEADPGLRVWIVGALGIAVLAAAAGWFARGTAPRAIAASAVLGALGLLAWALAVPAYPDTYRRSQVPYLTLSVDNGRRLYLEHCTACHGAGGLGDGPLAASLPKPPANLSAPHTALHTVGDMYWWLRHGIPQNGMPGLGDRLSEDDRWDLINFLRAFSQGFESRILRAAVVPEQAWLGSINFYLEGGAGLPELKAYRGTHNLLLAFLGGERAAARAEALAAAYPGLQRRRTEVLILPLAGSAMPDKLPFPVLAMDADEIWSAYELLSRTAADRGAPDRLGMAWTQAEFLVDRFGYVRARWIAQDESPGWSDPAGLYPQLDRLNAEPRLRPPPDDHIH